MSKPGIMDRDLFVDESIATPPHRLSRGKGQGTVHCLACNCDVKPVYEYSWCGTEPFAFCPDDPHAPSNKKAKAKEAKWKPEE